VAPSWPLSSPALLLQELLPRALLPPALSSRALLPLALSSRALLPPALSSQAPLPPALSSQAPLPRGQALLARALLPPVPSSGRTLSRSASWGELPVGSRRRRLGRGLHHYRGDDYFYPLFVLIVLFSFVFVIVELRVQFRLLFVFIVVEVFHLFFVLRSKFRTIPHAPSLLDQGTITHSIPFFQRWAIAKSAKFN
jgi:hypothetical protein